MWSYDEDESPVEVPAGRVMIGTIYLLLGGTVFNGLVHLLAQG